MRPPQRSESPPIGAESLSEHFRPSELFPQPDLHVMEGVSDAAVGPVADRADSLGRALAMLEAGRQIRVRLLNGRILEGPFLGREDEVLRFDDVANTTLRFAQIDTLWEQRISKKQGYLTGSLVLGVLGGAVGAYLALAVVGLGCLGEDCPEGLEWFLAGLGGFAYGAGAGATVGVLLGGAFSQGRLVWVQRFPVKAVREPRSSPWGTPASAPR